MPAISQPGSSSTRSSRPNRLKRAMDVGASVVLLFLTGLVMAISALLIRLTSRGPIIFRQTRIGQAGAPFCMLKFRTMYEGVGDERHRAQNRAELGGGGRLHGSVAFKDADDPRVTRVGGLLRRFSIDELPQLLNVLRGDMSLVGPRPSLPWEVEMFPEHVMERFSVKPGITGPWQVGGRNELSMVEMLELDCAYANHWTPLGDIRILIRTIPAVFHGSGAA